jgi:hypothetical protein
MRRTRERPVPVIPSSHVRKLASHAAQVGPKNPLAQEPVGFDVSPRLERSRTRYSPQVSPANPGWHAHTPVSPHLPPLAHGTTQLDDWRSNTETDPVFEGRLETSATLFHATTRLDDPTCSIAYVFGERRKDETEVAGERVELVDELEERDSCDAIPWNMDDVYAVRPGSSDTVNSPDGDPAVVNPTEGFEVEVTPKLVREALVYMPGRRTVDRYVVAFVGVETTAPAAGGL